MIRTARIYLSAEQHMRKQWAPQHSGSKSIWYLVHLGISFSASKFFFPSLSLFIYICLQLSLIVHKKFFLYFFPLFMKYFWCVCSNVKESYLKNRGLIGVVGPGFRNKLWAPRGKKKWKRVCFDFYLCLSYQQQLNHTVSGIYLFLYHRFLNWITFDITEIYRKKYTLLLYNTSGDSQIFFMK